MDKNTIKNVFLEKLNTEPKNATVQQIHNALGETLMELFADDWQKSREKHLCSRRACYFSMEFLVGRAIFNNLLCLGIYNEVSEIFEECGISLNSTRTLSGINGYSPMTSPLPFRMICA